ncbi:nuclear transport factor 2 family protein [Flavivirga eckloniae]|uniref:DUF4440 domain-containing protein n=1 Tax=Flavivirga eckloniae TaxID=1803846 RepID=A0A2K9PLU8_9FLAO|nr:nuclear transport factor 2 family protein [Flavivirga eckloniae]AUP77818.1 hypothetical protein C1H87_03435 [Flavivirga eckloniae]
MKRLSTCIVCLLIILCNKVTAQNINELREINTQIWSNFTKSFETLDYQLFESLHSDDLIRVNGGDYKSIKRKDAYLGTYKSRWTDSSIKQTISFRFLERISKDGMSSERGIYKFTINPDTESQKSYYGKFHVILKKKDNRWKILIDYDSTENKSINEASYNEAFPLDEFSSY